MLNTEIKSLIISLLKDKVSLTKKEIVEFINLQYPGIHISSITWMLYKLKSKGFIQSPTYGVYNLHTKESVEYSISNALRRLYNKVKKEFPFLQLCVWDSRWFNSLMLHQPFRYYLVVEVEKESMESVFNTMTDFSKKIFLNPTEEIFTRYISNFSEVIIIKPLLSEAPTIEQDGILLAPFEKLLVDCLADKDLFSAQQGELDYIYITAFSRYGINVNKLKRYARRRSQITKAEELINKTLAK